MLLVIWNHRLMLPCSFVEIYTTTFTLLYELCGNCARGYRYDESPFYPGQAERIYANSTSFCISRIITFHFSFTWTISFFRSHINLPLQQWFRRQLSAQASAWWWRRGKMHLKLIIVNLDVHAIYAASSIKTATRKIAHHQLCPRPKNEKCTRKRKSFIAIPNTRIAKEEELCARWRANINFNWANFSRISFHPSRDNEKKERSKMFTFVIYHTWEEENWAASLEEFIYEPRGVNLNSEETKTEKMLLPLSSTTFSIVFIPRAHFLQL